jgi:hypothetical protein
MTRAALPATTALAAALMLGGCTHYVPRLAPSLRCDMPASLTAACDGPEGLPGELTYGELIALAQRDRQRLLRCGVQQQDLARAVALCSRSIEAHNTELDRINQANQDGAKSP